MSLDPGLARAGALGVTRLVPAAGGRRPAAGAQRMMRLYLAPARLASAIRPFWPKTTSWIGRLIWVEVMPAAAPSLLHDHRRVGAELPAVGDAEVLQRLGGHEEQRLVELGRAEGQPDAERGERVVVDLGRADHQRALAVGAGGEEADLADLRDDEDALGAARRARRRRGRSSRARPAPRRRRGRSCRARSSPPRRASRCRRRARRFRRRPESCVWSRGSWTAPSCSGYLACWPIEASASSLLLTYSRHPRQACPHAAAQLLAQC